MWFLLQSSSAQPRSKRSHPTAAIQTGVRPNFLYTGVWGNNLFFLFVYFLNLGCRWLMTSFYVQSEPLRPQWKGPSKIERNPQTTECLARPFQVCTQNWVLGSLAWERCFPLEEALSSRSFLSSQFNRLCSNRATLTLTTHIAKVVFTDCMKGRLRSTRIRHD